MREQCGSHNETERSSKHNLCEFEGLKLSQFVQRPAALLADSGIIAQAAPAKLRSSQNKKRPPLTMEPSIDDPLAATTVTPAQAGVQRKDLDSRLRGNDENITGDNKTLCARFSVNDYIKAGGAIA